MVGKTAPVKLSLCCGNGKARARNFWRVIYPTRCSPRRAGALSRLSRSRRRVPRPILHSRP
jgi:hypothetical protein